MRASCRTPDRPWAWAREITRNEAHRMYSRRSMTHELPTERLPEEAEDDPAQDDVLTKVDVGRALELLSPRDRLIVSLRYERDLTHAAVASQLGMSVSNVKVRLHRLRPQLQRTLPSP
jgi:RNA polymerase sigma factor (sigma-70 family)